MTTASLWEPTQTLDLRPYQVHSIEELREALRQGYRRIILCAPTGSGKTEMAIQLVLSQPNCWQDRDGDA